ncbi:MAG: DUF4411 family protein [Leptospiraceae bacterium]|nr:DUF4411 family protein [Leptospiraceae bacterium]
MSLFLIDTNVISELAKNKPCEKVLNFFETLEEVAVSVVTIEEIEFGISRTSENYRISLYQWWEHFLSIPPIVFAINLQVARTAGHIRAQLAKQGKQITQADALIAATAMNTKRILVTRNVKDFQITGIQVLNPF